MCSACKVPEDSRRSNAATRPWYLSSSLNRENACLASRNSAGSNPGIAWLTSAEPSVSVASALFFLATSRLAVALAVSLWVAAIAPSVRALDSGISAATRPLSRSYWKRKKSPAPPRIDIAARVISLTKLPLLDISDSPSFYQFSCFRGFGGRLATGTIPQQRERAKQIACPSIRKQKNGPSATT